MPSYIVLVSPSVGGAEKRFFDILTGLRRNQVDVSLIAPSSLIDRLKADHPERADVLEALIPVPLPHWSPVRFLVGLFGRLRTLPKGSTFHYPVNCLWPLHLGRGDRISMSMVDCTRVPSPRGGTRASVWTWLALHVVRRVDVLSPAMLRAMQGYRSAPKMTLTPGGTYLVPPTVPMAPKSPIVVFLGRLVPGKGVDDLLDVLPALWALLRETRPDCRFEIAGYGALEAHVIERTTRLRAEGVPVEFIGYASADEVLGRSAVALSLQEPTNYPSRVVAEALMAGCAAIVRDTGDSREFGTGVPGLLYCAAKLDARELASQMTDLIGRVLEDLAFRDAMRRAARERFSSPAYIQYFQNLIADQAR